jgi:seryl-tRNA synthetase
MTTTVPSRQRVALTLSRPANDLVQEEIGKQVGHLSREISDIEFSADGLQLAFTIPAGVELQSFETQATDIARNVQRSLRNLERRIRYRSPNADAPRFAGEGGAVEGVTFTGLGQVALRGLPLQLFEYFDRAFAAMGAEWNARPLRVPTLVPISILAKCDYLRSFPHIVTFGSHLPEDAELIARFRERHQQRDALDEQATGDLSTPEVGLAPAVCYHAYALHAGETLSPDGVTYGACGKCFRYESSNMRDLRRLWDFTLREIIFIGGRDEVLEKRERGLELMAAFLESHEIAAEIRTASDPFFIAPDAMAKAYFQLSSDTKYEVAAYLPDGGRLAVGSLNYHSDFFGRAFDVTIEGAGPMHSVCIGFGLERWIHVFLAQHGTDPSQWPRVVREAPEFQA